MEKKNIEIEGIKTEVLIFHPKEIGTPLYFLHGWGGSAESFLPLAKILEKERSQKLVLLNLPGFGKADMPPKNGWDTNDYADWLTKLLKAVGQKEPASFYGHSFGCRVLVRFAKKHPKMIDELILTGAAGIKWPPGLKQKVLTACAKILKPIFKPFLSSPSGKKGILGKIKRKFLRLFGAHDWEEADEQLKPTLKKVLAEEDFRDELLKINISTLLLWGAKDTYTPLKSAKVYAENLPNNKLIVFPDGRHGIHYTHTQQIATIIIDETHK